MLVDVDVVVELDVDPAKTVAVPRLGFNGKGENFVCEDELGKVPFGRVRFRLEDADGEVGAAFGVFLYEFRMELATSAKPIVLLKFSFAATTFV